MALAQKTTGTSLIFLLDKYRLVLTVEGTKDLKVYQALFRNIYVKPNTGKKSVVDGIKLVESNPKYRERCRALIDRDYDFFFGKETKSRMIVYTDAHSLETQLWKLDDDGLMLSKILSEIISFPDDLFAAMQKVEKIYELAFDSAYKIGVARLASERYNWGVGFNSTQLHSGLYDPKTDKLDIHEYLKAACKGSYNANRIYDIIDKVDEMIEMNMDKWEIMQGHDIGSSFVYYLKRNCKLPQTMWGNLEAAANDFEKRAREVCLMERLKKEDFYKTIHTWETTAKAN